MDLFCIVKNLENYKSSKKKLPSKQSILGLLLTNSNLKIYEFPYSASANK